MRFIEYVNDRDSSDVGPEPMGSGEMQRDPDRPNKAGDLMIAMKEIIQVAKRAMQHHQSGLGDLSGNGKPTDEKPDNLDNVVTRPGADSSSSPDDD